MSKADEIVVGVAWSRREQWPMLRALSTDVDTLEETFDEWVEYASRQVRDLEARGIQVRKIDVDAEDPKENRGRKARNPLRRNAESGTICSLGDRNR